MGRGFKIPNWRKINRKHKDRLFRFIFQNKKDLLQLYNAVNNNYDNPDDLEINTLKDVIYIKMKNDLSFIVEGTLNLYEHQSTFSKNLPLRGMLYYQELYKQMAEQHSWNLFGSKRIMLPTPQYIVFYNGNDNIGNRIELKLSDAFENKDVEPCLECKAIILNINSGHNSEILQKCRRLYDYAFFVAEVNCFKNKAFPMDTAVEKAIDSCIEKDILRDILLRERRSVRNMILTEYNEKAHLDSLFEDGKEEGRLEGIKLAKLVFKLQREGKTPAEIAETFHLPVEEVNRILD